MAVRLISSFPQTGRRQPLEAHRSAALLAIFYCHVHADSSCKLPSCMPPPFPWPHCTRWFTFAHHYSVQLSNVRVNHCLHSFLLSLVGCRTASHPLHFSLLLTWTLSGGEFLGHPHNKNWITSASFRLFIFMIYLCPNPLPGWQMEESGLLRSHLLCY